MFKVTPIGSCRITGPLRHGHASYGIQLNLDRCYGYCHSPAEAVQMAHFMQGRSSFHEEVWPLVSRSHELESITASRHEASDLYVVELASAKELSIDGVLVQLNYLNSAYSDFFSDAERAQAFWACAEAGDEIAMAGFLDQNWSGDEEQRREAATLARIRLQFVTRERLRRSLKELAEILPDVLIVSHIDARKPDGELIRSRSDFIDMVAQETSGAGLKFYNPTDLMTEFGQAAAIEDESTGLAHFTKDFSDAVMDDWMRRFIAPKTDAAVLRGIDGALEKQLAPQVAAAQRTGRFVDAELRLNRLSEETGDIAPMMGSANESRELARSAFAKELASVVKESLDETESTRLIQKAVALGLFETALELAANLSGGLKSLPVHRLLQIGERAYEAGDTDNAFEFFLAAVTRERNLKRASTTLAQMAANEEIDLLAEMPAEQGSNFLSLLSTQLKLALLKLNGSDFTPAVSAQTTATEATEIVSEIAAQYGIESATPVLTHWCSETGCKRISDQGLLRVLDGWVEAASAAETPADCLQKLTAILEAAPRHNGARNAMRDARTELVGRIRKAGKARDIEALEALSEDVSVLNSDLPEFDLWRARLRYGLGEYGAAIEHGQSAATSMPETINIWVLLMRAADKAKNAAKATEFARKVIALACSETEKLKFEAEAVLQSHLVRA